jgi:hypothetical protein
VGRAVSFFCAKAVLNHSRIPIAYYNANCDPLAKRYTVRGNPLKLKETALASVKGLIFICEITQRLVSRMGTEYLPYVRAWARYPSAEICQLKYFRYLGKLTSYACCSSLAVWRY